MGFDFSPGGGEGKGAINNFSPDTTPFPSTIYAQYSATDGGGVVYASEGQGNVNIYERTGEATYSNEGAMPESDLSGCIISVEKDLLFCGGHDETLRVYDISDRVNVSKVGEESVPSASISGQEGYGFHLPGTDYLYTFFDSGIDVWDISDPSSITHVNNTGSGIILTNGVYESGNGLFKANASGSIRIIDFSDRLSPSVFTIGSDAFGYDSVADALRYTFNYLEPADNEFVTGSTVLSM